MVLELVEVAERVAVVSDRDRVQQLERCAVTILQRGAAVGHDQAVVVSGLLKEAGFIEIEVKKDLTGFDRLILCRKKGVEEDESKS